MSQPDAPQVDFYLLRHHMSKQVAACLVAARYGRERKRLWLHTDSRQKAEEVDKLLWTFSDTEFVPHSLAEEAVPEDATVLVSWPQVDIAAGSTVLNLAEGVLSPVPERCRVIELVVPEADEKAAARTRFREYRDCGLEPQHVEIDSLDAVQ